MFCDNYFHIVIVAVIHLFGAWCSGHCWTVSLAAGDWRLRMMNEMGGHRHVWGGRVVCAEFWWWNLKEGDHIEDIGIDGKIILKWILMKQDVKRMLNSLKPPLDVMLWLTCSATRSISMFRWKYVSTSTITLNPLTPNVNYSCRISPLTSKRCILYIYSTNIVTEYFKHSIYSPFFSDSKCSLFHNFNVFGFRVIHSLYTGCAKIKKIRRQKVNHSVF